MQFKQPHTPCPHPHAPPVQATSEMLQVEHENFKNALRDVRGKRDRQAYDINRFREQLQRAASELKQSKVEAAVNKDVQKK
ncbi:hypothetical protein E8E11_001262 [Didymella keratinophila]|nr:hypothetical protein E8E11_001262 [Didymella keratinophila]